MRKFVLPCLIAFALVLSGCYSAQVTTEKEPGGETIEMRKTGFVNGLVMQGMPVDGARMCPNGVASVSTELTFLDQFLGALTGGIYSPMTVTLNCASGEMSGGMSKLVPAPDIDFKLPEETKQTEVEKTISAAAQKSATMDRPVQVKFTSQ